jgi:hypothetical protein
MKKLLSILGIVTEEELSTIRAYLVKRFYEEHDRKVLWQERADKLRRIAQDLASKYNDLEKIKDISEVFKD